MLVLVKHAAPAVDPGLPAANWVLSEAGRASCDRLADRLAALAIDRVITSVEPKARETGERVAARLGVPCREAPGLHEQARRTAPYFTAPAQFRDAVRAVFARPGEVAFGEESADQAHDRFRDALAAEVDGGRPAVVAHGTVIALVVGRASGIEPVDLWEQLGLPSYVVCTGADCRLVEVVGSI